MADRDDLEKAFMAGYMARWNDETSKTNPYTPANGGKAADLPLQNAWYGGYDRRLQEEANIDTAVPTRERGGLAGSPSSKRVILRREH